nr:hypothetical protein [Roseibacillus ishigakijimensis]
MDPESLCLDQHASWLVRRVLTHGCWADWQALLAIYGRNRLEEIARELRNLEPRAHAFCEAWFDWEPSA